MFRKMRRFKQQITDEQCIEVLKNSKRGVLSLIGEDGYPYGLPINQWYCEEDGKIYFHGAMEGHKNDAIKKHDKVSYCVMDSGVKKEDSWWYTFRSVIIFGKIKTIADKKEKIDRLTYLGDKFFPTHEETVREIDRLLDKTEVFEITIDHISGKIVREK
jgi:nitroimidazol reductase NimA-like FMN-containing flavoprotein (pyridoxamine 5'-phosphate oxidase superfamily)